MKWYREPLVHFLAIGALLFGIYLWLNDPYATSNSMRIEVSANDVELLHARWIKQWQRPPTERELEGLIEAHIREEVLYREALALGLDSDDTIVRRRMAQKMEFLVADVAVPTEPDEAELRAYFETKQEHYHAKSRTPATIGYAKGVSMGGDLRNAPKGKAPTFLVAALKDPIGGNLDRIQIVKGWIDAKGKRHERVYDAVWSGNRKSDAKGKLSPVGNTVDVAEATWTNTIGATELITVWKDPGFDPNQRAFYYARVIEIPTPRWTAYDAKRFGIKMSKEVPMFTQERAYTSPIWYTP